MSQSETINALAEALAKAQGEMSEPTHDKTNPHFKSKYASLAAVHKALRGPLAKNGLAWVQALVPSDNGEAVVRTVLMHSSGQWIDSTVAIKPDKPTPQGFGSALTYARRYGLSSLTGVYADEDDDANTAEPERKPFKPTEAKGAKKDAQIDALKGNPKDEVIETVREWSGIDADLEGGHDLAAAVKQACQAAGVKVEAIGKTGIPLLRAADWRAVSAWCKARRNTDFLEALKDG
jgi:hypothetical protein